MIEVFKTNVRIKKQASKILTQLLIQYPKAEINFDLNDCDKILRVEGESIEPEKIIEMINTNGYQCEVLI